MKTRLFPNVSSLFVGASILALVLVAAPSNSAAQNTGHDGIIGTWLTSATFATNPVLGPLPYPQFTAVETFNADGTMHVISDIPGDTIAIGLWKQTGPGRFTLTFTFYRPGPDPLNPTFNRLVPTRVQENLKLTNGGANYESTDTIMPLDSTGAPYPFCSSSPNGSCVYQGTVNAQRDQLSNFNTTLP